MRLRRLLAALFATLVLAGPAIGPAAAAKYVFTDGDGSCADLYMGDGGYFAGTVNATAYTHEKACGKYDYVLRVFTTAGDPIGTAEASVGPSDDPDSPNGSRLTWQVTLAASPDTVCVTLSSETNNGTATLDSAPDNPTPGCVIGALLDPNTFPAGNWQ